MTGAGPGDTFTAGGHRGDGLDTNCRNIMSLTSPTESSLLPRGASNGVSHRMMAGLISSKRLLLGIMIMSIVKKTIKSVPFPEYGHFPPEIFFKGSTLFKLISCVEDLVVEAGHAPSLYPLSLMGSGSRCTSPAPPCSPGML